MVKLVKKLKLSAQFDHHLMGLYKIKGLYITNYVVQQIYN